MNVLSLDTSRVIVEESERALERVLTASGFDVLPCRFRDFNRLGGSFHCATLDIRRRGGLAAYL
jgi:glycine amidinotransferase